MRRIGARGGDARTQRPRRANSAGSPRPSATTPTYARQDPPPCSPSAGPTASDTRSWRSIVLGRNLGATVRLLRTKPAPTAWRNASAALPPVDRDLYPDRGFVSRTRPLRSTARRRMSRSKARPRAAARRRSNSRSWADSIIAPEAARDACASPSAVLDLPAAPTRDESRGCRAHALRSLLEPASSRRIYSPRMSGKDVASEIKAVAKRGAAAGRVRGHGGAGRRLHLTCTVPVRRRCTSATAQYNPGPPSTGAEDAGRKALNRWVDAFGCRPRNAATRAGSTPRAHARQHRAHEGHPLRRASVRLVQGARSCDPSTT